MAQAVERILGKDEVGGSSPPISSMIKSPFSVYGGGGDFYFALTRLAKSNPEYAALQNDYEAQQKILAMFNKALESSQNNNTAESSSAKYALKEYSQHQINNWKNSKRIVVYESQNQLQQFIDDAMAHKNLSQKMYFGIINDETANFIFQKTNIDVHNYNAVLRADSILKIFDSHGNEIKETQRGQRAISDKDILLLPELFGEIDYAEYQGKYQGMQGSNDFINVKSHLYPSITIGLVVQNKQLDIRVQTMYATKKGSNAAAANTVNNQSLPLTPETDNGNASSNNTVPQSDTAVNNSDMQEKRKFSLKEPAEETKDLIAVHNITAANMHKALDLGGFDEIAYVVIPDNADDGLKSALTGNGIKYREYEAGNERSRVDVLNSLDDVKFSRKESADYSYDTLVSKPDMAVTNITDGINYRTQGITRKDIVNDAVNNAKNVGRENENGNAVIYVDDIGTDIIVPKKAIQHSLDRRIEVNGPVVTNIGNILKNSIKINELIPRSDNIEQSYVLIGAAKNQQNEPFIVSFVVNEFTNEVKSIDVLYSVNAKKEPAGSSKSPQLSTAATGSKISISDLLDYVNRYYPDILPEDVLKHYGYTARPSGVIGENALYSLKEEDNPSIFEDNDELNDAAESLQEMLRYVSAENNELRSAFDIKTVRSSDTNGVAKAAAYLRKQYDSHYKNPILLTSSQALTSSDNCA